MLNEKASIADGIGMPDWKLVLCLAFSWIGIGLLLMRGIQSTGKASYFLALFPYATMAVLLVRAVTLPGAMNGIMYFLTPQWGELLNPSVSGTPLRKPKQTRQSCVYTFWYRCGSQLCRSVSSRSPYASA